MNTLLVLIAIFCTGTLVLLRISLAPSEHQKRGKGQAVG